MGWRFRRSVKIAPGVRWNFGTRGSSWSIGPRGFKLNFSKRGVRRTVSIPGTGISHSEMLRPSRSTSVATAAASPPIPPRLPVRVFGPLTDETAIEGAARWAIRDFPLIGRLLVSGVIRVTHHTVRRCEVRYTIKSKRVVVRTEPVLRKTKPQGFVPDPAGYNAWAPDIDAVLQPTRTLCACPSCGGEGSLRCPQCNGAVDVVCDVCGGDGRALSERTLNLVSCRSCGGDGRRRCPCRDGIVWCSTCNGKAVVNAWLGVEDQERVEIRVSGAPGFAEVDPSDSGVSNVTEVFSWSGSLSDMSVHASELMGENALRYEPESQVERIDRVTIQEHESEIATVQYELAGRTGSVAIEGWSGELKAEADAQDPVRAAKRRVRQGWWWPLVASAVLLIWFGSRHQFYAESAAMANLALLTVLTPLALIPPIAYSVRPRARKSTPWLLAMMAPAAFLVATQVQQAITGPTVLHAQALRSSGDLAAAQREARAAAELGRDGEAARALHDDVQVELLAAGKDPARIWTDLQAATFFTDGARKQAERSAIEKTASYASALREQGNFQRSLAILAGVPDPFRESPQIREGRLSGQRLRAEAAVAIVNAKGDITQRLAGCQEAKRAIDELKQANERFPGTPAVERTCKQLVGEQERQTQLAKQRRRAERAQEERAERARLMAPLRCRDGTLSPSCVCGGSRRGCCSGHGGVSGCSQ
jgi:hypothetical protein